MALALALLGGTSDLTEAQGLSKEIGGDGDDEGNDTQYQMLSRRLLWDCELDREPGGVWLRRKKPNDSQHPC